MNFHDGLAADLPSPRDDEPNGLRDDIVDELADHLSCAYRRELLRGADVATARKRILERFGDPAAVARRLWLDAMRGRIMTQRILVLCCIVLTLISLSLVAMLWMSSVRAQRLAAMAEARAALEMRRAQEAQAEILKQLKELSQATQTPRSPDWIPVSFQLSYDRVHGGEPASGFMASLGRGVDGSSKEDAIRRKSDEYGKVDFGVVQPGDWEFTLSRTAEHGGEWKVTDTLNVLPGTSIEKQIVCPRIDEPRVPVSVHFEWPGELPGPDLSVISGLEYVGGTFEGPPGWLRGYANNTDKNLGGLVLVGNENPGEVKQVESPTYFWILRSNSNPVQVDLLKSNLRKGGAIQIVSGHYRLRSLILLKPTEQEHAEFHGTRGEVLAAIARTPILTLAVEETPTDTSNPLNGQRPMGAGHLDVVQHSDAYWREIPDFKAEKGESNEWKIKIPDALLKAAQEKLEAESKAAKK
jgi:hypothetical protein